MEPKQVPNYPDLNIFLKETASRAGAEHSDFNCSFTLVFVIAALNPDIVVNAVVIWKR